jgi:rubredoxin
MKKNKDFTKCIRCGKSFRVTRAEGDDSKAPELIIKDDKNEWICPDCRDKKK